MRCCVSSNGSASATSQYGKPFARTVDARSERHGAEAPRKSNFRVVALRPITRRRAKRSCRAAVPSHETKNQVRCHTAGEEVHSGTTSNASEYKCGNNRGSANVAFRMQASQHPASSPREPSLVGSARYELGANPSIEGTCNIWLRQLSPAPHVKR